MKNEMNNSTPVQQNTKPMNPALSRVDSIARGDQQEILALLDKHPAREVQRSIALPRGKGGLGLQLEISELEHLRVSFLPIERWMSLQSTLEVALALTVDYERNFPLFNKAITT